MSQQSSIKAKNGLLSSTPQHLIMGDINSASSTGSSSISQVKGPLPSQVQLEFPVEDPLLFQYLLKWVMSYTTVADFRLDLPEISKPKAIPAYYSS